MFRGVEFYPWRRASHCLRGAFFMASPVLQSRCVLLSIPWSSGFGIYVLDTSSSIGVVTGSPGFTSKRAL